MLFLTGDFSVEVTIAEDGLQEVNKTIKSDMYSSCFKDRVRFR